MKKIILFTAIVFLFSCQTSEKKQVQKNTMYERSEMAALMLQMYHKNEENKKLILEGKQPKDFPEEFLKIHTAKLTDSTDRNASFEAFSNAYLKNFREVFSAANGSLKEKHNSVVNSCIACHKTTCIGPIPRIKKLYIQ
jgi:cytochrome c553